MTRPAKVMLVLAGLLPASAPIGWPAGHVDHSANGVSGMVHDGALRVYAVEKCGYNVSIESIPNVYSAFAAHQVEWNYMGLHMPWWSVITGLPKTADIPEKDKAAFYGAGEHHVDQVVKDMAKWAGSSKAGFRESLAGKRVLDFGCGLGRLAFAFANDLRAAVTCVDQSVHHLRLAKQEWTTKRARAGVVEFVVSSPDLLAPMLSRRFDFVHSVIAMQHMVPALQAVYLEQLCDLLVPGGTGWIQMTIRGDSNSVSGNNGCDMGQSIAMGGMQMHSTPIDAIKRLLHFRGCRAEVHDVGHAYIGRGSGSAAVVKMRKQRQRREAL